MLDESHISLLGKPQIPYIKLLIAVPDSCGFKITVRTSDYITFSNYRIYPVPRIVFENDTAGFVYSKEQYTYDTTFYQKDTVYPDKFYEVNSAGHWRDQRVLEMFLYPIQCNPAQNLMFFYTGFEVIVEYTGTRHPNTNGLGPFEEVGREVLLNYSGGPGQQPQRQGAVHYYTDLRNPSNIADYIVVTHNDLIFCDQTFPYVDSIAHWRALHNDFDVGVVTMQDIYAQFPDLAPDSAAQLCQFLNYAYDIWHAPSMPDGHFGYCLFIGDWDYVPTRLVLYDDNQWLGANEYYFADLDSNSMIDVMLGRWPVKMRNWPRLATIASKTIHYEKDPDPLGEWRRRGLLISGGKPYDQGYIPDPWFENILTDCMPYFADIGYDTLTTRWNDFYPYPDTFRDSIQARLNRGGILVVYVDHGGPQGWYRGYDTTYVKTLRNEKRLPVVLSAACMTAMFQWDHPFYEGHSYEHSDSSFGEVFLFNPDGGAVAFFGATEYAFMPEVEEMVNYVLRRQHWTVGKFLLPGLSGRGLGGYCFCLLGDPALDIGDYTAFPGVPDLVVRPRGFDMTVSSRNGPYHTGGDTIWLRTKVLNIGSGTASNVDVRVHVQLGTGIICDTTVWINQILPRDSAIVLTFWNTQQTHPDYYGVIGDCNFLATADPDYSTTETWKLNNNSSMIERIALYPNKSGWPKKLSYNCEQQEIANLDRRGSVEIVYPNYDSIFVFDDKGNIFPGWPQYFWAVNNIVLGDLNTDNYIEVVAVSHDSIKVYNYQGSLLWRQWLPANLPDYYCGYPAMGYIKGTRKRQVAIFYAAKSGNPKVLVYDYNGNLLYTFENAHSVPVPGGSQSLSPSISDVNGDGKQEIVLAYETMHDPGDYWDYRGTDVFNRSQPTPLNTFDNYGNAFVVSALADLTGDNTVDMITSYNNLSNAITAYDIKNSHSLWSTPVDGQIWSSPAAGDINTNLPYPGLEITFCNDFYTWDTSQIQVVWGLDGRQLYPYPRPTDRKIRIAPALAKLEGAQDISVDIVIAANDGNYIALKYTGDTIPPYRYTLPVFGGPMSSPVIGDIDGDGISETILSSGDYYLHVWKNVNSFVSPYLLEWPQFHHDYQRTGGYGWLSGLSGSSINPQEFSTATTISFALADTLPVQIRIFDTGGNAVKTLVNQILPAGTHQQSWDGKNDNNSLLPNGLYFVELKVEDEHKVIPVKINR